MDRATTSRGERLALVVLPHGIGCATADRSWSVAGDPAMLVTALNDQLAPRWVWWSAAATAAPLVAAGVRPRTCWDLAAVHRVLHGGRADDPARVWAGARGLDQQAVPVPADPGRLDLWGSEEPEGSGPVLAGGHLRADWVERGAVLDSDASLDRAATWAALALEVQAVQEAQLRALPDHRRLPGEPPLALLTAFAESAAALVSVELEHDGLPVDRAKAEALLASLIGPRPRDQRHDDAIKAQRDDAVRRLLPADVDVDLRNPASVGDALRRVGIDLPDTRAWRLEPYRSAHPVVDELLRWRKAERIATTYGYGWLDRRVSPQGRLRGEWEASDGAAGRMTAGAGLHNMPADLRVAVVADAGHVFVRADLGQIEPRVLAAVSGDAAFARAAADDDLYAPVAERLRCDRPTAKVAVLAAMYGQTSGAAGQALRRMEETYPQAISYLRTAEESGRAGIDLRTYGGRLVRLSGADASTMTPPQIASRGRYARNAAIQGAAAELFKAWVASVRTGLLRLEPRSDATAIVLCLHDELLVQVPESAAGDAVALVARSLAETSARWAAGSDVRFVADISVVRCWADAKGSTP